MLLFQVKKIMTRACLFKVIFMYNIFINVIMDIVVCEPVRIKLIMSYDTNLLDITLKLTPQR